ncbi:MAG: prephenate dehydratase [Actinomycetales bacterium]
MAVRIVYQGEPGANSHLICRQVYPDSEPVAAPTFEHCFDLMADGSVDLAMIPIENSLAGRVADIHHLLPESGLHIIAEHFLPIHFQLMALPDARIEDLTTVCSHVHALGQCRALIRELGLKPLDVGDTAGAARQVAEAGDLTRAALAPAGAAELYGLQILRRDVEDAAHNTTRFVVLSREPVHAAGGPSITTFVFRVRNIPASLYKGLGGFATNGVNMTKLESYQLDGSFVSTQFYADVEGHPHDRPLALALEELVFFTTDVRILGVYPRHPYRDEVVAALAPA